MGVAYFTLVSTTHRKIIRCLLHPQILKEKSRKSVNVVKKMDTETSNDQRDGDLAGVLTK
jgi:hypothetical protein